MRKALILPLAAICGGIGGFFLRRWELASAFEPGTGLPIPNAPATWALIAFSVAVVLALLLLCRGKYRNFSDGYDQAFAAKGNTVYILVMALSALLLLGVSVLTALGLPGTYQTALSTPEITPVFAVLPNVLLALLALASFFCVLLLGKNGYRGEGHGKYSLPLLMPAYMTCIWLISAYQLRAGDPIRLDYIYELLAIIAALLGLYFTAGFSFERGKPFRTALFSLMGVYLSLVTLADTHDTATILLYGFVILYLTANVTALLYNNGLAPCPTPAVNSEIQTEVIPDEGE